MQLGSDSNGNIRGALDTILKEFVSYDAEKQSWMREKSSLLKQLTKLEREVNSKNEELDMLTKRYKVLEMSMQSMNISLKKKGRKGDSSKVWSATLPISLDNSEKILQFINELNIKQAVTTELQNSNKLSNMLNDNDSKEEDSKSLNDSYTRSKDNSDNNNNSNRVISGNMNLLSNVSNNDSCVSSIEGWINLRYHFDSVRCLCYDDSHSTSLLVSGSDDGVISLWNLENVMTDSMNALNQGSRNRVKDKNIYDPWISYHGHNGSVICTCMMNGTFATFENTPVFATGGSDGSIMIWKAPNMEHNNRSDFDNLAQWRVGHIKDTKEIVWDIKCHSSSPIIASVSADRVLKLFDISNFEELSNSKILSCELNDYATCVEWNSTKSVVLGCSNGSLQCWDTDKGKQICEIIDDSRNGHNSKYSINKIAFSENWKQNLIYAACSDNRLRCFDLRQKRCVIRQNVHTASVSDICILDPSLGYSIVTVSDDCRMRAWNVSDLRLLKDLETIDTHRSKNDEGINCVVYDATSRIAMSGGADGNVRLYKVS